MRGEPPLRALVALHPDVQVLQQRDPPTCAWAGPMLDKALVLQAGEQVRRDGRFPFVDLLPR